MLQHLRTCQATLLGDMANQDDGRAALLGELEQSGGTLTDLSDAVMT